MIVAFRRQALLALDDCRYAAKPTRSALPPCLQRHGISRRPAVARGKPGRQWFALQALRGDIAALRSTEGKLQLFVAINRTSKVAAASLVEKPDRRTASAFPEHLLDAVPWGRHTVRAPSPTSWRHESSPAGAQRALASRPATTSAKSGLQSQTDSSQPRPTGYRD